KLEPFNFDAHYELGLMYQYLKRFEAAITAYQKAVEIRPLDPHANMNLAMVYTQMDQPLRGLGYAQRAVNGDDQSPLTHANLGVLYSQIGYSELAIDELQKAIELNSKEPQVFLALIGEYIKLKQYVPARNVADAGCKISPTAALHERLGTCLYFLGTYEEARTAFENALKLDETYYMALNGLGATAMRQALQATPANVNLARQAVAYWQRSLKVNPNQPNIKGLLEKYTGKLGLDKPEQP
ncbi:MAG: tetratricopeptide repeat protein, partial [Phycisphaerae bacterium]